MVNSPRIIPVLDVMDGVVVHAVAGERANYRPVVSVLTSSTEPRAVADVLLQITGSQELYIADLNAIQHRGDNFTVLHQLRDLPVQLWLDAGGAVRPGFRPIIGLETYRVGDDCPRDAIVSVDLNGGQLLGAWPELPGVEHPEDVLGVVRHFVRLGLRTFILIDLQTVGRGQGPSASNRCHTVKQRFPMIELITGGGVRHWADVEALTEAGADGVLVASALHAGTWR